ncbi:MAG TPA: DUF262 domain-containing protein [Candidatus Paceibacterota bacterium]
MKAQDRIVKDWLSKIRSRQLGLPRFQRYEAWKSSIISDFWTSLMRGLPVGVSLILEVSGEPPFKYRFIAGAPTTGEQVRELLLDGQQRLTALWRALTDDYEDRTYLVGIETEDGSEFDILTFDRSKHGNNLSVVGEARYSRKGQRFPLWVDDPAECLKRGKLPLRILNPDNGVDYQDWCERAAQGDTKVQLKLVTTVNELRNRVENFNIPYLYLPAETEKSVVIDVFIKLNTSYAKLTVFDILVAQVEEEVDASLHDLLNTLKADVPEMSEYTDLDRYALSVAALLQDKLPNEQGYLSLNLAQMAKDWPRIINGSKELVELLEGDRIYDSSRLPTEPMIAAIAALLADTPTDPDERGNRRILLRKYMWHGFFTARYDRSVATRILPDFRELKKVIDGASSESSVPIFNEAELPLPTLDDIKESGWPKTRDRLARAILLASFSGGAIDFADASPISRKNILTREYHHLFPVALLKEKGLSEKEIYRALNCVLITWKTNRKISRKEPIAYLLEHAQASSLGEAEIRRRLASHSVDDALMRAGDYDQFMNQRAETIHAIMIELCGRNSGQSAKKSKNSAKS